MSEPPPRIELPPEAEPARDFIEALVGRYEKRIRELEKQVQSLTEQLQKLTPRNSSLTPSTEHPHAKPDRKKRPGKKRNRGGQSGHKRHQRALVPVEACTTFTALHLATICEEVRHLLLRGKYSGNAKLEGFCDELHTGREHLWTFTRIEGVEPTNNASERALRPAVIYRKLSFGTQSAWGSRFLERLLTISETCRLQNRNAYQFLIEAMRAKFEARPAPTLLPQNPAIAAAAAV